MTLSALRWAKRFQGRAMVQIIPNGGLKTAAPD
jgi:hypothetical protein